MARASFSPNLIGGRKVISAFQLAGGYIPSLLGTPLHIVSEKLLHPHIERELIRALESIPKSQAQHTVDPEHLNSGIKTNLYYKSPKNNEPNEWIIAYFVKAVDHIVKCSKSDRETSI